MTLNITNAEEVLEIETGYTDKNKLCFGLPPKLMFLGVLCAPARQTLVTSPFRLRSGNGTAVV